VQTVSLRPVIPSLQRAKLDRQLHVPSSPTRSLTTTRATPDLSHAQARKVDQLGGWSKWKVPCADPMEEGHKLVFFSYPSKLHLFKATSTYLVNALDLRKLLRCLGAPREKQRGDAGTVLEFYPHYKVMHRL
jgi:hypothetical protein